MYIKISSDIIDKEIKNYIKYEKLFIFYNDKINNIKNIL